MIFYCGGGEGRRRQSCLHFVFEPSFLLTVTSCLTPSVLHFFKNYFLITINPPPILGSSLLSPFLHLLPPSLPPLFCGSSAGHLHGLSYCTDSLSAVRVGAGPRAGAINRTGAGQGGCPGAGQAGHAGRGHWREK